MAALIAVNDFWFADAKCPSQASQDKGLFQGARKFEIHNPTAVPVNDDEEIHESTMHPDVCNINAPDLIRVLDVQFPQKVRADELGMIPLAEIRLGINGIDAHISHHASDFLSVDTDVMVTANDLGNRPIAPRRMIRVQFVDSAHDEQVFV